MINNSSSNQTPQSVHLVRPGKKYLYSLGIKHWLLRKERDFELQENEQVKWQRLSVEHYLEKCLLIAADSN